MPPTAKKSRAKDRLVPVLVAGRDAQACRRVVEALDDVVDGAVEFASVDELVTRLDRGARVGFLVIGPDALTPGDGDGLARLLDRVRAVDSALPLIVDASGLPSTRVADAFRLGVQDVVFEEELSSRLPERLASLLSRRESLTSGTLFPPGPGVPRMIGSAPSMLEVARLVERVAPSEATVLILGESGTGKELVAKALHAFSPRRKGPFVAINCAAIPEALLENELFGHEKGAYTGANASAIGKVEAAEKGTLFLDEIGEMPIQLQAKILRLLQDKTYDRIGGTRMRTADIRIIAATNRDLKEEADAKRFREDLYYRLSVVPIPLPGLRDKPEDIPLIVSTILERLAERLGRPGLRIGDEAMERLVGYRWPGNVRELENELERAAVLAPSDEIRKEDLELRARVEDPDAAALSRLVRLDGPLRGMVEDVADKARRIRVSVTMDRCGGDRSLAALNLGITEEELDELL